MKTIASLFLIFFSLHLTCLEAIQPTKKALSEQQLFERTKEGVVSIESRISHGPYTNVGLRKGTGFLVDKEHGFVVTNRHITGSASVGIYFVTFFTGRQLVGRIIYEDPFHDFSILKINPEEIPETSIALEFSKEKPKNGQSIVIVGKNEGQDFSFQTGRISSLYEIAGHLPGQSMRLSLNTRGGSSGSPVFNTFGDVIALNHSGNDTSGFALHTSYITKILADLKKEPLNLQRWELGVNLTYEPIDKLVRHLDFPENLGEQYRQTYTDASGKILVVERVYRGSPVSKKLRPGDAIWSIDGVPVGPNLAKLQTFLDKKGDKTSKLTIIRQGEILDIDVTCDMVLDHQVQQFVEFGGGIFYLADDFTNSQTGCGIGSVMLNSIAEGGALHHVFYAANLGNGINIRITSLNNRKINSLDDLVKEIPQVVEKKHFGISFKNYGASPGHDNLFLTSRAERIATVSYTDHQTPPRLFTYDKKKRVWTSKLISLEVEKKAEAINIPQP